MLYFNSNGFSGSLEMSMLSPSPFLLTNRTDYSRFLNTEALINPIGYDQIVYLKFIYWNPKLHVILLGIRPLES